MMDESIPTFERSYYKIAGGLLALSGLARLAESLCAKYLEHMEVHWVAMVLPISLFVLSVPVYFGYRWAWAIGILLCTLLVYSSVSGLIDINWPNFTASKLIIISLTLAGTALAINIFAIVFLFLAEYKRRNV